MTKTNMILKSFDNVMQCNWKPIIGKLETLNLDFIYLTKKAYSCIALIS